MNVIIAYLETMFSSYPQTPRLLEAKEELRAMMEDAYSGLIAEGRSHNEAVGQVITEFGNLDELAPSLGISAEIGGAAPAPSAPTGPADAHAESVAPAKPRPKPIQLDEAQRFADARRRAQPKLATAVALFVLAPAAMFLVIGFSEQSGESVWGQSLGAISLLPLLVMIAIGVIIILSRERSLSEFKHITQGNFSGNPVVVEWVRDLERTHERRRITSLQIAVGLWILAAAPILLSALLFPIPQGGVFGVAATLAIVAAGLVVLLPTTWASDVARELTRVGTDVSGTDRATDGEGSIMGVIAAIYWPLLTAVFLAWSFIGDAWDRSWIVWPIGAVLFGAIAAGTGAWTQYQRSKR